MTEADVVYNWTESPTTISSLPDGDGSDPASITTDSVLKVIYMIIAVLGLTGNALVLAVIGYHSTMLKAHTNLYILNQSVIDGTVSVILLFTTYLEDSGRYLQGIADDVFCRIWASNLPLWGLLVSSSYNLVAMTIERYLAVVYPIWHKVNMSRAKVIPSLVIVWFIGPLYQMAFKLPSTRIVDGKCILYQKWPDQLTRQAVGVFTVIIQYLIPISLLCAFYGRMAFVLHNRIRPSEEPGKGNSDTTGSGNEPRAVTNSMARARRNVIKTLAIVSLCYVLCWTCSQMYFLVFNLGKKLSLSSPFYHFTVIAVYINSCLNPFVYATKYEQFQQGLSKLSNKVSCGRFGKKSVGIVGSAATKSTVV